MLSALEVVAFDVAMSTGFSMSMAVIGVIPWLTVVAVLCAVDKRVSAAFEMLARTATVVGISVDVDVSARAAEMNVFEFTPVLASPKSAPLVGREACSC